MEDRKGRIREFLGRFFRNREIGDQEDIFSLGFVNSMFAMQLVTFVEHEFGFTIELHTQRTRLPHVMFEVRQDEIDTPEKALRYADILARALAAPLASPELYTRFDSSPETPGLEGFSWRRGSRL